MQHALECLWTAHGRVNSGLIFMASNLSDSNSIPSGVTQVFHLCCQGYLALQRTQHGHSLRQCALASLPLPTDA